MHRTQIQLEDEQWQAVARAAAERGVSSAQVIRDAVDRMVPTYGAGRRARAVGAIGGFRSGHADVAQQHDEHLADAFGR